MTIQTVATGENLRPWEGEHVAGLANQSQTVGRLFRVIHNK